MNRTGKINPEGLICTPKQITSDDNTVRSLLFDKFGNIKDKTPWSLINTSYNNIEVASIKPNQGQKESIQMPDTHRRSSAYGHSKLVYDDGQIQKSAIINKSTGKSNSIANTPLRGNSINDPNVKTFFKEPAT